MPKAPTQAKTVVKKSIVKKTVAVFRATATERVFIHGHPNKLFIYKQAASKSWDIYNKPIRGINLNENIFINVT